MPPKRSPDRCRKSARLALQESRSMALFFVFPPPVAVRCVAVRAAQKVCMLGTVCDVRALKRQFLERRVHSDTIGRPRGSRSFHAQPRLNFFEHLAYSGHWVHASGCHPGHPGDERLFQGVHLWDHVVKERCQELVLGAPSARRWTTCQPCRPRQASARSAGSFR